MKVICAGLSRTGTTSLAEALRKLDYTVFHYAEHLEQHGKHWYGLYSGAAKPNFEEMYKSSPDAVADIPPAYFFEDILKAFPDAKVILTTRDEDKWFKSFKEHVEKEPEVVEAIRKIRGEEEAEFVRQFVILHHRVIYGSEIPNEFIYKQKFRQHNERVIRTVPPEQLLVLPVESASWSPICEFLGQPIPETKYPCKNTQDELLTLVQSHLENVSNNVVTGKATV
eukprot:CAMPEP_0113845104 /NCGR_PEP_ID=MMETSP0372-20130328/579_1 /TAXON_ID=340204 /ORGANISM="Lankesteria abbotti" /LENGTH=224 /DNA_ID=CAMNT_0000814125 /DNA_START=100 /DNA_END=774 /DNA_ORIENTATION=+ /assembly_acc=CAM_ASM_000359